MGAVDLNVLQPWESRSQSTQVSYGGEAWWLPAAHAKWKWEVGRGLCWVPTWFLACLYRVCFKTSESKVELSTSLTSSASSAALRRSSPFPKVGVGSKANRPPPRSSTHLRQGPGRGAWGQLFGHWWHLSGASRLLPVPACMPRVSTGHMHKETDTRTHRRLDGKPHGRRRVDRQRAG